MLEVPINNGGPFIKGRPCIADLLVDSAVEKGSKWYSGKISKNQILSEDAYEARISFPIWEIVGAGSGLQPPHSDFRESSLGLLKRWKTSQNGGWLKTL